MPVRLRAPGHIRAPLRHAMLWTSACLHRHVKAGASLSDGLRFTRGAELHHSCSFWIANKRRWCAWPAVQGQTLCGNHTPKDEYVPCAKYCSSPALTSCVAASDAHLTVGTACWRLS